MKGTKTLIGQKVDEKKEKFRQVCAHVRASDAVFKKAWDWIHAIYVSHNEQLDYDDFWSACALYLAGMMELAEGAAPLPLTLILTSTRISLVDLFEPLKDFVTILKIGEGPQKMVRDLQQKHINCSMLYKKYVSIFENMLHIPLDRVLQGRLFKIGWLLYLVAKETFIEAGTDLISEYNVLIACCALIYMHVAPTIRQALQSRVCADNFQSQKLDVEDVVGDLCDMLLARASEVLDVYNSNLLPMIKTLCKDGTLKCQQLHDGEWDFASLFDAGHLEENVAAFDVQYSCIDDERVRDPEKAPTHLDERKLLVPLNCIGSPSRLGQRVRSYYNYPKQGTSSFRARTDALQSPRPLPSGALQEQASAEGTRQKGQPVAFINETFQSVSWLRSSCGKGPSKRLLEFILVADRNSKSSPVPLLTEITDRCSELCAKVDFGPQSDDRKDQAVNVYMKMLESLLIAEERRLQTNDFSSLLRHDVFHRSLVACAVEIVQFCYKLDINSMAALDAFDVKPFEMIKIIEAIVRHTPNLPESVVRHFNEMEQVILQERAWNSGSTLFRLLSPEEQKHLGTTVLSSETDTQRSTAATPMSPLQRSSRPRPSNFRSSSLELFYRKIMVLSARRTRELCLQLRIPTMILEQVWAAFSNILLWRPNLVENRHLDQIMMCTLYGICRANRYSMTFQNIIDCYRRQPQATGSTWRDVLIGGEKRGDIIEFYNRVFIRELESYLLKFKGDGSGTSDSEGDTSIPVSPLKIPASPIQVESRHNLYMSPLNAQRQLHSTSPLMTHSIGYSPSKNLSSINSKLTKRRALFRDDSEPNKRQKVSDDSATSGDDRDVQVGSHDLATLASLSGLDIAKSPESPRRKKQTKEKEIRSPKGARKRSVPSRSVAPSSTIASSAMEVSSDDSSLHPLSPPSATASRKSPRQPKPRSLDE